MIESKYSLPYTIQPLRRLLSILLLAVMGLAAVSPLFALTPRSAGLPACCRKNGKHHCEGSALMPSEKLPAFTAQAERCPYGQVTVASGHSDNLALAGGQTAWNAPVIHAAFIPNMQFDHSGAADSLQYKRGPPALFPL